MHAPAWMKRPHGFGSHHQQRGEAQQRVYADEEVRMVQEVLGRMIFQAGVDYECVVPFTSSFEFEFSFDFFLGRARCERRQDSSLDWLD